MQRAQDHTASPQSWLPAYKLTVVWVVSCKDNDLEGSLGSSNDSCPAFDKGRPNVQFWVREWIVDVD